MRPAYCPFCLGDKKLPAATRLAIWTRDHHLWTHVDDEHVPKCVWPAPCPHPLCGDSIADGQALGQHLVDTHSLSRSRPGIIRSRKRKHSDEAAVLEWAPEYRPLSSERNRLEMSLINPRLLSEPTSVAYHIDETAFLRDLDLHNTPLNGCTPKVAEFPQLKSTDTYSADDSLFSEFLRSRSPSCTSVGEFSGCSSDTAVVRRSDQALSPPSTEPLCGDVDQGVVRANGQSNTTGKPIRIRLRVSPPQRPPQETKILLRLKGPKPDKGVGKGRKKRW